MIILIEFLILMLKYISFYIIHMNYTESEFNEFEPRLKSAKTLVSIERRLKSWTLNTILSGTNYIWVASEVVA